MNEFENDPANDDLMVEITNLDPTKNSSSFSSMFETLEKRPLLRKRFWRFGTASCSVLLIALVLFGTFPSARGLVSKWRHGLKEVGSFSFLQGSNETKQA